MEENITLKENTAYQTSDQDLVSNYLGIYGNFIDKGSGKALNLIKDAGRYRKEWIRQIENDEKFDYRKQINVARFFQQCKPSGYVKPNTINIVKAAYLFFHDNEKVRANIPAPFPSTCPRDPEIIFNQTIAEFKQTARDILEKIVKEKENLKAALIICGLFDDKEKAIIVGKGKTINLTTIQDLLLHIQYLKKCINMTNQEEEQLKDIYNEARKALTQERGR